MRNTLAVSSLEIEIDGDVGGLTGELAHASYVDRYELDRSDLRNKIVVWPSDVEEAAVSIPALLNRASGVLLRYEWVTPDLDAAFLHLVGDTAGSEGAEDGRGGL